MGRRTAAVVVVGAAVAGSLLWLLATQITTSAAQGRRSLEERTASRTQLAQRFIDAYLAELLDDLDEQARATLAGPQPSPTDLASVARTRRLRIAVVADGDGRVVRTFPEMAGVVGADIRPQFPVLDEALAGRRVVTSIQRSPLTGEPLVAVAVPFEVEGRRRVLAGGFVVEDTPLGDFLRTSNVITGQRIYLVDAAGAVVSGEGAPVGDRFADLAPELAAVVPTTGGASIGTFSEGGQDVVFLTAPLATAPWRVVTAVPAEALYQPLETSRAAPWTVFGAFAAASGIGLVMLTGILRQRWGLQASNRELEALTASLSRSEEQVRRVIETAGDAFVAMDEAGLVTGWNDQAARTFGRPADEAIGQVLHDLIIPEEFRRPHQEGLARFLATGEGPVLGQRIELEALRADGGRFPVEISIWALAGRRGWDFNALVRDISERRRQQEALADSEQRLRLTQEGAATGIALVGLDGRWLQVNPALCAIVGRSAEELAELTFVDVAHPDDLDLSLLRPLLAGTVHDFQVEGRCVRPDGSTVWTQINVSLLRSGGGAPQQLIIQVLDIDERRRHEEELAREIADRVEAEQAARRERDRLSIILGAMDEGYLYSVKGQIVDVNDRICELTGFRRDELVGQGSPYPFWPPDEVDRNAELAAAVREAQGGVVELDLQRRDGGRFPVSMTVRPAVDVEGAVEGFITIVRDLTDIKRREGALLDIAARDGLTGLFNRRAIDDRFTRLGPGDAVVVLDLDHFKRINDTYGHAAGDLALTSLAACIRENLREGDWAGRLGGEEFIIVAREGGDAGGRSVVSRLRATWTATEPLTTFSAGIAVHTADAEPRQTLARADEAMYRAKRNGRDRTEVFAGSSS